MQKRHVCSWLDGVTPTIKQALGAYVFIFGNFDGFSNLMVSRFFNDRDIILDSNLLSDPTLRSSPSLLSNSTGGSLNKILRSIPERLPPLSCKSKFSIIYLRLRWLTPVCVPQTRDHKRSDILRTQQLRSNCGDRCDAFLLSGEIKHAVFRAKAVLTRQTILGIFFPLAVN